MYRTPLSGKIYHEPSFTREGLFMRKNIKVFSKGREKKDANELLMILQHDYFYGCFEILLEKCK